MDIQKTFLGIEFGSTRIKAVLIDENHKSIAQGSFDWENRLENGIWTYHLDDVWRGVQTAYKELAQDVERRYGKKLDKIGALGISAMMHGYLAFDKAGNQLAEFRTWRNTTTEAAAQKLSGLFKFNIPIRWSIAHLYQAMLNGEKHVAQIDFLTTLAGYVHWKLTGERALGIGDASGMFPIDSTKNDYDQSMIDIFEKTCGGVRLRNIFPRVLCAGALAGKLTDEGARLLDPSGVLQAGVPMCPPEGDAGTGMVATNSVAPRTGNVSAGTSIFAMVVLEKALSRHYAEIDMVTTPAGMPVAMVHCNNCTSDIDAWVRLLGEAAEQCGAKCGAKIEKPALYDKLYAAALEGEPDCGGLVAFNYYSGEPITGCETGRPLFTRLPDSRLTLANFMRAHLFSAMAALKIGMDILTEKEHVRLDVLLGHGGLFKTREVGQRLMAAALNVPLAVMESAGEGGAWGIAILAAYCAAKQNTSESLESYLQSRVFSNTQGMRREPDKKDVQGFEEYIKRYIAALPVEKSAIENI